MTLNILIIGLGHLGIETVLNLLSCNKSLYFNSARFINSITLHDDKPLNLCVQSIINNGIKCHSLTPTSRSLAFLESLIDNKTNTDSGIKFKHHTGNFTETDFAAYNIVVITDNEWSITQLIQFNEWCRSQRSVFLVCSINGLTGFLFSDFGSTFTCIQDNGREMVPIAISNISRAKNGLITLSDFYYRSASVINSCLASLSVGDLIQIYTVNGATEYDSKTVFEPNETILNINSIHRIKEMKGSATLTIGNTTEMKEYVFGGFVTKVLSENCISFQQLRDQLYHPTIIGNNIDRALQLHVIRLAIWRYQEQYSALPRIHNTNDSDLVFNILQQILLENTHWAHMYETITKELVSQICLYFQNELHIMAHLWSGILSEQIMKMYTKTVPIQQWLHMDALEILINSIPLSDKISSKESIFKHEIEVFGHSFQQKIFNQNVLLPGYTTDMGAKHLKLFSSVGLGSQNKLILVNQQEVDAKQTLPHYSYSSDCIKIVNRKVDFDNDLELNDLLWEDITLVISADKSANRSLSLCSTSFKKPLFSSCLSDSDGCSMVCIPYKTIVLEDNLLRDSSIVHTVQCSLNEPEDNIDCLTFAKVRITEDFITSPLIYNAFLQKRDDCLTVYRTDQLLIVKYYAKLVQAPTVEICIQLSFNQFYEQFTLKYTNILASFPADCYIENKRFWSGTRRYPKILEFDQNNELHIDYIYYGHILYANLFNIQPVTRDQVKQLIINHSYKDGFVVEPLNDLQNYTEEEESELNLLLTKELENVNSLECKELTIVENNYYNELRVEWLTACANILGSIYSFKIWSKSSVNQKVNNIILTNPNTISCMSGLIGLEIYKYLMNLDTCQLQEHYINVALNLFWNSNLCPVKYLSDSVIPTTGWDILVLESSSDITLQQFIELIENEYPGWKVLMLAQNSHLLYMEFINKNKSRNLATSLLKLCESKSIVLPYRNCLSVQCQLTKGSESEDRATPEIHFQWPCVEEEDLISNLLLSLPNMIKPLIELIVKYCYQYKYQL